MTPSPVHPRRERTGARQVVPLRTQSLRPELPRPRPDRESRPVLLLRRPGHHRGRAGLLGPIDLRSDGPSTRRSAALSLAFLGRYLGNERGPLEALLRSGREAGPDRPAFRDRTQRRLAGPAAGKPSSSGSSSITGIGQARPDDRACPRRAPGASPHRRIRPQLAGRPFSLLVGTGGRSGRRLRAQCLPLPGLMAGSSTVSAKPTPTGAGQRMPSAATRRSLELNPEDRDAKSALEHADGAGQEVTFVFGLKQRL